MKQYFLFIPIILLSFSCNTESKDVNTSEIIQNSNSEKSSLVKIKQDGVDLENDFYKHYAFEENGKYKNLIFNIKQKESVLNGKNNTTSSLEITPFNSKENWKIKTQGHSIDFRNNTLIVKNIADFDHEDTYSAYNINNGNHLLDYTYNMLMARIPASNFKRYIGFVSRSNNKELLKKYDDDVLGIFTYASDEKMLQQFVLKTEKEINKTAPSMAFISSNDDQSLYENDALLYFMNLGKDVSADDLNFSFGFSFYEGEMAEETAIMFSVKNDKIDLKNAKFDTSVFELEEK